MEFFFHHDGGNVEYMKSMWESLGLIEGGVTPENSYSNTNTILSAIPPLVDLEASYTELIRARNDDEAYPYLESPIINCGSGFACDGSETIALGAMAAKRFNVSVEDPDPGVECAIGFYPKFNREMSFTVHAGDPGKFKMLVGPGATARPADTPLALPLEVDVARNSRQQATSAFVWVLNHDAAAMPDAGAFAFVASSSFVGCVHVRDHCPFSGAFPRWCGGSDISEGECCQTVASCSVFADGTGRCLDLTDGTSSSISTERTLECKQPDPIRQREALLQAASDALTIPLGNPRINVQPRGCMKVPTVQGDVPAPSLAADCELLPYPAGLPAETEPPLPDDPSFHWQDDHACAVKDSEFAQVDAF